MSKDGKMASGGFTFTQTAIEGATVVDVKSCGDACGYFMKMRKHSDVQVSSADAQFVQGSLREGSSIYSQWESRVLSTENRRQFFIPRGFAYDLLMLSDTVEFWRKRDDVQGDDALGSSKTVLSKKTRCILACNCATRTVFRT